MTLQDFAKAVALYTDIDCETDIVNLAHDHVVYCFNQLSDDDKDLCRLLCDARIADTVF